MQPESLIKLVGTGGVSAVEHAWMSLVESDATAPEPFARYDIVLAELCKVGRQSVAETLAWTAIETLSARFTAVETLSFARPFLQATGDKSTLRPEVAKLYKQAYAQREGLDALLAESGLEQGRPVRRALRTLEVALAVKEGDFLASRDDETAARVDRIDNAQWVFDITNVEGAETLAAMPLADRYVPTSPSAFRVLRQFTPDVLAENLENAPATVVIGLCREHGNAIGGEKLEAILTPVLPEGADWKKWFSKARAALKKIPQVTIEGRPPYVVRYVEAPKSLEDSFLQQFESARDPMTRLEAVEDYVRECRGREKSPSVESFSGCYDVLAKQAGGFKPPTADLAGVSWLAVRRVGELAGKEGADAGAVKWMAAAPDPGAFLARLPSEKLFSLACDALIAAKPKQWQDIVLGILPTLSHSSCDSAAIRLEQSGRAGAEFDPIVQKILGAPTTYFEALLWLWDGPTSASNIQAPPLITLLTRILRTLEECRRNEKMPKDKVKAMAAGAKSILSARRYERFRKCLGEIELGMASALKTQLRRLELLSRATRDDLLNLIRDRFPALDSPTQTVPAWKRADVLFVTDEGLARKNGEIDQLVNVKMKENARAIGEAASHGDLSENSEYKFALEERDLLRARLAQMNTEVSMAKILSPADVPTDHVGVGTRVILKRVGDGKIYEMAFLGPWEADLSSNVFNYLAPMAQEIMGKQVGEVVEFNHSGAVGSFEICELHNALTFGDAKYPPTDSSVPLDETAVPVNAGAEA